VSKELAKIIAGNVRRLRIEQDTTQTELAARIGLPQQRIWEIESATGNPTAKTLAKVAGGLGVGVADLVTA